MSSRRRLSPEQRRDELMDIGATLFAERSYEDITMEDVARQANTSRALVYHYFPSKPEFFAAIWKRAHDRLLSDVNFEGASSVRDSVAIALEAYLSFYEAHVPLVVIANRSSIAADPVLRLPIAESMRTLCERLLESSGIAGHARSIASVALAGWIVFVREVTVEWLLDQRISKRETLDLCLAVLDVTLGSYIDE
jgi:AcrR family transcriptional regulator